MARRDVPTVEVLDGDLGNLIGLLQTASDLAVAIVAGSYLDACLANLIRSALPNREATDHLLDIDRPLGSFGARYQLARAMNLVDDGQHRDLKTIGKIRNLFAHHHVAHDFEE